MITIKITLNIDISNWCKNKMNEKRMEWRGKMDFQHLRFSLMIPFALSQWLIVPAFQMENWNENIKIASSKRKSTIYYYYTEWLAMHCDGMMKYICWIPLSMPTTILLKLSISIGQFLNFKNFLSFCHFEYFKYSFDLGSKLYGSNISWQSLSFPWHTTRIFTLPNGSKEKGTRKIYTFASARLRHRAREKIVSMKTNTDDGKFFSVEHLKIYIKPQFSFNFDFSFTSIKNLPNRLHALFFPAQLSIKQYSFSYLFIHFFPPKWMFLFHFPLSFPPDVRPLSSRSFYFHSSSI